jgi:tRNA splicing endonuclease
MFETSKLPSIGRLGNSVKKDVLMSSVDKNGKFLYITLKWNNITSSEI